MVAISHGFYHFCSFVVCLKDIHTVPVVTLSECFAASFSKSWTPHQQVWALEVTTCA